MWGGLRARLAPRSICLGVTQTVVAGAARCQGHGPEVTGEPSAPGVRWIITRDEGLLLCPLSITMFNGYSLSEKCYQMQTVNGYCRGRKVQIYPDYVFMYSIPTDCIRHIILKHRISP